MPDKSVAVSEDTSFGPTGADDSLSARIAQAEAAVAALAAQFLPLAKDDLVRMQEAAQAAHDSPDDRAPHLQKILETAHNMKGQGGSFGFELLTQAAGSLCEVVRSVPAESMDMAIIDHHLRVIGVILEKEIRGSGGELGEQLIAKLKSLTAPFTQ